MPSTVRSTSALSSARSRLRSVGLRGAAFRCARSNPCRKRRIFPRPPGSTISTAWCPRTSVASRSLRQGHAPRRRQRLVQVIDARVRRHEREERVLLEGLQSLDGAVHRLEVQPGIRQRHDGGQTRPALIQLGQGTQGRLVQHRLDAPGHRRGLDAPQRHRGVREGALPHGAAALGRLRQQGPEHPMVVRRQGDGGLHLGRAGPVRLVLQRLGGVWRQATQEEADRRPSEPARRAVHLRQVQGRPGIAQDGARVSQPPQFRRGVHPIQQRADERGPGRRVEGAAIVIGRQVGFERRKQG